MKILKLHDSYGGSPLYVVSDKITVLQETTSVRSGGPHAQTYSATAISLDGGSAVVRESVSKIIDMMEAER